MRGTCLQQAQPCPRALPAACCRPGSRVPLQGGAPGGQARSACWRREGAGDVLLSPLGTAGTELSGAAAREAAAGRTLRARDLPASRGRLLLWTAGHPETQGACESPWPSRTQAQGPHPRELSLGCSYRHLCGHPGLPLHRRETEAQVGWGGVGLGGEGWPRGGLVAQWCPFPPPGLSALPLGTPASLPTPNAPFWVFVPTVPSPAGSRLSQPGASAGRGHRPKQG